MKTMTIGMMMDLPHGGYVTFDIDVPDDATEEEIHQQAYREFREIPIDVESYEETE